MLHNDSLRPLLTPDVRIRYHKSNLLVSDKITTEFQVLGFHECVYVCRRIYRNARESCLVLI
jgi:hypothetical protein